MSDPVRQVPRGGIRIAVGVLTVRDRTANSGPVETARLQRKLATVVLVKLSVLTASEGPVTSCESAVPETPRASPDRFRLGLEKRRCRWQYRPVRKIR